MFKTEFKVTLIIAFNSLSRCFRQNQRFITTIVFFLIIIRDRIWWEIELNFDFIVYKNSNRKIYCDAKRMKWPFHCKSEKIWRRFKESKKKKKKKKLCFKKLTRWMKTKILYVFNFKIALNYRECRVYKLFNLSNITVWKWVLCLEALCLLCLWLARRSFN